MHFLFQFNPPVPVFGNEGKYPLYGIVARISDISKSRRDALAGKPYDLVSDITVQVGDLANSLTNGLLAVPVTVKFFRNNIFRDTTSSSSARNGIWTENMMLSKKVRAEWRVRDSR